MKQICIGVMAHVDAGKTTLAEGLLYVGGALRRLGRVDHGDAFLDTDAVERERGITIFSKQAVLTLGETRLTLLDTPGHVDFSAETERAMQVMDYALLVISGTDGVQGHTKTLWRLLRRYRVPTFLFINKMDLAGAGKERVLRQLQEELDEGCVDFTAPAPARDEALAMCGEEALDRFLETGEVPRELVCRLIRQRRAFPCWFGSALKVEGVEELLAGLEAYTLQPPAGEDFGARVFKISRDGQGARLTWMKITGGRLRAKDLVRGGGEEPWEEKADQLRLYSGEKFRPLEEAEPGMVVAVTGLTRTRPGQGLGQEGEGERPLLEPALTYQLFLPQGTDPHALLPRLRQLEEEDPMLRFVWKEREREIHVQLMGQVQLEVLGRMLRDRLGLEADFGPGSILYKETIAAPVEGVGHFEPLRHYAEVHLLLEPGERGSGFRAACSCPTDQLEVNWQRLVLTHLLEREHPGVLTGSPLTDVKVTLVAGRAHVKHTEGGDFRQATYRAVRQGLMGARSVLLEPCYEVRLEVPADCVGRAMADLQAMGGTVEPPKEGEGLTLLTARAPVAGMRDYWRQVTAYTRGQGRLSCSPGGYVPCQDQDRVVAELGYDPERDVDNPADSVFCSHGSGQVVKWDQVRQYMHVDSGLRLGEEEGPPPPSQPRQRGSRGGAAGDRELMEVFERTYGKVERQAFQPQKKPARTSLDEGKYHIREQKTGPEYLLVDGYNIIFAWEELKALADQDVAAARAALVEILANYQGYRKCVVILVFDAYKVKGNPGSVDKEKGVYVVYTREAETADAYIEKATYDLQKEHRVRVATSDALEQLIILGHGALRLSARAFREEVEQVQGEIARLVERHNRHDRELDQLARRARIISGEKKETAR